MKIFKIGGGEDLDMQGFLEDFSRVAGKKILVHGGNVELTSLQNQLGKPPVFVNSSKGEQSRFTDREAMELFWMVYCGRVNTYIVQELQKRGVNALGLSGLDGGLAIGKRREKIRIMENGKPRVLHGDFSGSVERINTELLEDLLDKGYVPVISPPAMSYDGEAINVDGDKLACLIAKQLQAEALYFFFAAAGLLKDATDDQSVLSSVFIEEYEEIIAYAQGRMKKKLLASKWAIEGGVGCVMLGDGRSKTPISDIENGKGTRIIMRNSL